MAGQVLYLKWRPQRFEDVVGQDHVTQTLKNALRAGRIAHAYLFAGPRGTGKTTMARLLAKAVNCLDEDVNRRPCNECHICRAIGEGRLLDLIEMDAASHTGVDNASILRNAAEVARHVVERERTASTGQPSQNTGVWIRVPVIPGINDDAENLSETARFVREGMVGAVKRVELLGYHQLGGAKFQRLGRPDPLPGVTPPSREELSSLAAGMAEQLQGTGIEVRAR